MAWAIVGFEQQKTLTQKRCLLNPNAFLAASCQSRTPVIPSRHSQYLLPLTQLFKAALKLGNASTDSASFILEKSWHVRKLVSRTDEGCKKLGLRVLDSSSRSPFWFSYTTEGQAPASTTPWPQLRANLNSTNFYSTKPEP